MASVKLPQDQTVVEQTFSRGIVADTTWDQIPPGGLYTCQDWLVHEPGQVFKRGGWARHSLAMGGGKTLWVGYISHPVRVVAIDGDEELWDVTSENEPTATDIGSVGFVPKENSPLYVDRLILCDRDAFFPPKKVLYDPGTDAIVIDNLGGSPPAATHSTVYAGRIVLGRGNSDDVPNTLNRIWFSPLPDVESTWDVENSYIDTTYEVNGLAAVGGVLLVFSDQHVERILGGVPPGIAPDVNGKGGSDMQLQPHAGVGCVDARSIVMWDERIIFAGEEGVWASNGSSVESLTEKPDGTGIQTLWHSYFPRSRPSAGVHNGRQIIAGLLNRDFYVCTILDQNDHPQVTFLCHLPSLAWTTLSPSASGLSMAQGRTEEAILELYVADPNAPYVNKLGGILFPSVHNVLDGNGDWIECDLITRSLGGGPELKAYGFGRISYNLNTGDFDLWAGFTDYEEDDLIVGNHAVWRANASGTSGGVSPAFDPSVSSYSDGGIEWVYEGPEIRLYKILIGDDSTDQVETASNRDPADRVSRTRFTLFGDTQSLAVRATLSGPACQARIYFIEVEARPYATEADFNTS